MTVRENARYIVEVLKASLRVDLSFRGSWVMDLLSRSVTFLVTLLFFNRLYAGRTVVAGLTWEEMMVLLGTYQRVRALSDTLFGEVNDLCLKVEEGTLDFVLLKPLNPRLLVSFGRVRTTRLLDVAIAVLLVLKGAGSGVRMACWGSYVVLVVLGAWIKYCLSFCLNCTTFWFLEVYGLYGLFDQIFDLARYPSAVFRGLSRILFSYVLPVAALANLPTMALIQGPTVSHFVRLALHAVVWFFSGQLLWAAGTKGYTSASS